MAPGSTTRACYAMLVDGDQMAPTLLFWLAARWPARTFASSLVNAPTDATMQTIFLDEAPLRPPVRRVTMSAHPAVFAPPSETPSVVPAGCTAGATGTGFGWTQPEPIGAWSVVRSSADATRELSARGD